MKGTKSLHEEDYFAAENLIFGFSIIKVSCFLSLN